MKCPDYPPEEASMPEPGKRGRHPITTIETWLDGVDRAIYIMVAILFLAAAIAMGVYAILTFIEHIKEDFLLQLIASINDLLLVLIILEVFGTVRSYLSNGTTSVKPFLYIGIISATRRILAIGAQTTIGEVATEAAFRRLMIDLGVNGAVVLALALAVYLFGRGQPAGE
jgi:uncharacterized membrane protein (DUF373 family)